jgi:pseudouridine synthase
MILYPDKPERISKIFSVCSICSRRETERLIKEGRISLNGVTVVEAGAKAVINSDKIYKDGVVLNLKAGGKEGFGYYILNKPPGYLTTCEDPFGRKTIFDLMSVKGHFFPAGRLDLNSRGLVLVTNDGLLCGLVTHPGNMIKKEYIVTINAELNGAQIKKLETGIIYENETYRALEIHKIKNRVYKIILNEGKKREIRQMIKACGAQVEDLFRVKIANLSVIGLKEGASRIITPAELSELKTMTGYEKAAGDKALTDSGI